MGYSTSFVGEIELTPALNLDQYTDLMEICDNGPREEGPGGYLQWRPTARGKSIKWDGGEKFYGYIDWMNWLGGWLKARNIDSNGTITWQGEDARDRGVIEVVHGYVKTKELGILRHGSTKIETVINALKDIRKHCDHDESTIALQIAAEALALLEVK
jgi:hypothetical protein